MEAEKAAMRKWEALPLAELRRAAASGDAAAQYVLGNCYNDGGKGLAVSTPLAAEWRAKAAASGHAAARTALGFQYEFGQGVSQDRSETARLYRLAAKQGNAAVMLSLGFSLAKGEGSQTNLVKLARAGHTPALAAVRELGPLQS